MIAEAGNLPRRARALCVQSPDILYTLSLDILYTFAAGAAAGIQRSTIVERWVPGSSSRTMLVQ